MPGAVHEKAIHVEGLRELQRAFSLASREMSRDLRQALEAAGTPISFAASQLALAQISGLKRSVLPWNRMRVGVSRGTVWVAPEQRGVKKNARAKYRRGWDIPAGRPLDSFPGQLLYKAMIPALEANVGRVVNDIEEAIADVSRVWARAA
jgi:hypothetical protein